MRTEMTEMATDKPKGKTNAAVLKALKSACKGLLFPSESDKPVKAFLWDTASVGEGSNAHPPLSPEIFGTTVDESALKAAGKVPEGAFVKEVPLDAFFDPVVTEESWFGDEEKETAKRFRDLIATLQEHLTDLKALRVEGTGADSYHSSVIDAYVVGLTREGSLAGISTQLVET